MKKERQEIVINQCRFILRDAEDDDYEFIFSLFKENMRESFQKHFGSWNEKSFGENHHQKNIRIIECENSSVGYVEFKFKDDYGYLISIQLLEQIRGKGCGTQIMKILEQETLYRELNKIHLKVFKDSRAVKLYERLGYKTIFEEGTSLIMEKILEK
jgi:ribosomal protein S18 acetylase RimI-like enzyme